MKFRRDIVTLSFEGDSLRLLLANNRHVHRWEKIPVPPGLLEGSEVRQVEPMGEHIAKLFESENLPKSRVVTTVSGQRSIFRTLTLPPIEDNLLGNAVRRKVRQEIPMPGQEMDISYQVTDREQNQLQVFVVAVPRPVIERHIEAFQAAQVRVRALDVTPLALVRVANMAQAIVVGLENWGLSVVIVNDALPAIVRTVPFGSQIASPEARLDLLFEEMRRTTKFYNESHKENPLPADAPLVVTGSSFVDHSLRSRLAASVESPIRDPRPPIELPEGLPVHEFSVNLGLALKKL